MYGLSCCFVLFLCFFILILVTLICFPYLHIMVCQLLLVNIHYLSEKAHVSPLRQKQQSVLTLLYLQELYVTAKSESVKMSLNLSYIIFSQPKQEHLIREVKIRLLNSSKPEYRSLLFVCVNIQLFGEHLNALLRHRVSALVNLLILWIYSTSDHSSKLSDHTIMRPHLLTRGLGLKHKKQILLFSLTPKL